MAQKCPKCSLLNPPEAARRDCGYDFGSKSMQASYLTPKQQVQDSNNPQINRTPAAAVIFLSGATITGVGLLALLRAVEPGARDSFIQLWVFVAAGILNVILVAVGGGLAWANKLGAARLSLMAGAGGL